MFKRISGCSIVILLFIFMITTFSMFVYTEDIKEPPSKDIVVNSFLVALVVAFFLFVVAPILFKILEWAFSGANNYDIW